MCGNLITQRFWLYAYFSLLLLSTVLLNLVAQFPSSEHEPRLDNVSHPVQNKTKSTSTPQITMYTHEIVISIAMLLGIAFYLATGLRLWYWPPSADKSVKLAPLSSKQLRWLGKLLTAMTVLFTLAEIFVNPSSDEAANDESTTSSSDERRASSVLFYGSLCAKTIADCVFLSALNWSRASIKPREHGKPISCCLAFSVAHNIATNLAVYVKIGLAETADMLHQRKQAKNAVASSIQWDPYSLGGFSITVECVLLLSIQLCLAVSVLQKATVEGKGDVWSSSSAEVENRCPSLPQSSSLCAACVRIVLVVLHLCICVSYVVFFGIYWRSTNLDQPSKETTTLNGTAHNTCNDDPTLKEYAAYKITEFALFLANDVVLVAAAIFACPRDVKTGERHARVDVALLWAGGASLVATLGFHFLSTLFEWSEACPQIENIRHLSAVTIVLNVVQSFAQVFYLTIALAVPRRNALERSAPPIAVTLSLLLLNIALWLTDLAQRKNSFSVYTYESSFYEEALWLINAQICMPLVIFFRFHSAVICFSLVVNYFKRLRRENAEATVAAYNNSGCRNSRENVAAYNWQSNPSRYGNRSQSYTTTPYTIPSTYYLNMRYPQDDRIATNSVFLTRTSSESLARVRSFTHEERNRTREKNFVNSVSPSSYTL